MAPIGCGGGDDNPTPATSPSPSPTPTPVAAKRVFLNFQWAARTRNLGVDASRVSSALSATVRFYPGGARTGTPLEVRLNRDPARLESHSVRLEPGTDTGSATVYLVDAFLYSGENQSGVSVGTASFLTTLADTGEANNSLAVRGVVRAVSLSVPPLKVGGTADAVVTATDAAGNVVPVTPGSILLRIETGIDALGIVGTAPSEPSRLVGIRAGTATVTATVDDVSSAPVAVVVTP